MHQKSIIEFTSKERDLAIATVETVAAIADFLLLTDSNERRKRLSKARTKLNLALPTE